MGLTSGLKPKTKGNNFLVDVKYNNIPLPYPTYRPSKWVPHGSFAQHENIPIVIDVMFAKHMIKPLNSLS